MTEAASELNTGTGEATKPKRARKATTKAKKATKAKATKKLTKAKGTKGGAVDYKKWPQCAKCKRHIANMERHNKQHRTGEIGDDGKRTSKGRKAATKKK